MKRTACLLVLLGMGLSPVSAEEPLTKVSAAELAKFWKPRQPLSPAYPRLALISSLEGCFVAEYTIDKEGRVRDAAVVHSDARIRRNGWMGMKRSEIARLQRDALEAQESAILDALATMEYEPTTGAGEPLPVRTRTAPVIVSMLTLDKPDDAAAVARAHKEHEERRAAFESRCRPFIGFALGG